MQYRMDSDGYGGYKVYSEDDPYFISGSGVVIPESTMCPYSTVDEIKEYSKKITAKMRFIDFQYLKRGLIFIGIGVLICIVCGLISINSTRNDLKNRNGLINALDIIGPCLTIICIIYGIKVIRTCRSLCKYAHLPQDKKLSPLQNEYWELIKKNRGAYTALHSAKEIEKQNSVKTPKSLRNEQEILDKVHLM